jgi:hypothetical protein
MRAHARADGYENPDPTITPRASAGGCGWWTKDPGKIIAAVKRGHQALDSIH